MLASPIFINAEIKSCVWQYMYKTHLKLQRTSFCRAKQRPSSSKFLATRAQRSIVLCTSSYWYHRFCLDLPFRDTRTDDDTDLSGFDIILHTLCSFCRISISLPLISGDLSSPLHNHTRVFINRIASRIGGWARGN